MNQFGVGDEVLCMGEYGVILDIDGFYAYVEWSNGDRQWIALVYLTLSY